MSSRPRLVAEGSPIPGAVNNHNRNQQQREEESTRASFQPHRGSNAHPPLHQHGDNRRYDSHGHGVVTTHITIGGGSSSSRIQQPPSSSHQQRVIGGATHAHPQIRGSNMESLSMESMHSNGGAQSGHSWRTHHTSSLSAAAGPNVRARPPHRSNHNRPTQLHTHLVIGVGGSADEKPKRQNAQQIMNFNPSHAAAGAGGYPHRLKIGDYTGHVSAEMPQERRNVGVGHQHNLSHANMTLEDYDYDLLGGIPDHGSGHQDMEHCENNDATERMEVEDIIPLPPLIVIDGANVAYAFGKAKSSGNNIVTLDRPGTSGNASSYSRQGSSFGRSFQADAEGIVIACKYFMDSGCRVQVVLPAPWLQTKSQRRNGSSYHGADEPSPSLSEMTPQLEVLHSLREGGLLCAAPANDDDDSYAILLARREDARAARRRGGGQAGSKSSGSKPKSILEQGGGFVLSNDQFRDAQSRDRSSSPPTGLDEWLEGKKRNSSRLQDRSQTKIPGRISYSFGDIGTMDQYGDKQLDIICNPRHPLVEEIEQNTRARELSLA